MRRLFACLLLTLLAQPLLAAQGQADASAEQLAFLRKMQSAAHELDYSGVYTYQHGAIMTSSRVVHRVDGTGERERIEILDGTPREFIRHNDTTQTLLPEREVIVVERRRTFRFPSLLLDDGQRLTEYYDISMDGGSERVAGCDCDIVSLEPRDAHRYGHVLCVDTKSHLLLKAQTISTQNEVIDQVAFVSLTLGEDSANERITPGWDTAKWKTVEMPMTAVDLNEKGWRIPRPPGFDIMTQVSRPLRAADHVSQLVLSDGLAAISVFVEPFDTSRHAVLDQGGVHRGALSVFRKRIGDYWLTVLGQVPADTLRDIAEHVEYVPLAH